MLIAWLAVGTRAFLRSGWKIDDRIAIRQYAATSVRRIWAAVRATPAGREVYIENEPSPGYVLGPMLHHPEFPGLAGVFVLAFPSNVVDGHAVHFIEHQADVLATSRDPARNLRLSGLLVEPGAAPAATTR